MIKFALSNVEGNVSVIKEDLLHAAGIKLKPGVEAFPVVRCAEVTGLLYELQQVCVALAKKGVGDSWLGDSLSVFDTLVAVAKDTQPYIGDERYGIIRGYTIRVVCRLMHEGFFTRAGGGWSIELFHKLSVFFSKRENALTAEPQARWVADFFGGALGVICGLDGPLVLSGHVVDELRSMSRNQELVAKLVTALVYTSSDSAVGTLQLFMGQPLVAKSARPFALGEEPLASNESSQRFRDAAEALRVTKPSSLQHKLAYVYLLSGQG